MLAVGFPLDSSQMISIPPSSYPPSLTDSRLSLTFAVLIRTSSEDFIPTLIQLTSLQDFHIITPRDGHFRHPDLNDKLPSSSIPHLETYEGPFHLLPVFVNIRYYKPRRLRFVKLWGLGERASAAVCDPHQLEPILGEMTSSETSSTALETLHVPLTHVTTGLLVLLSRFINLREIVLESQDSLIPVRSSLPRLTMELLPESPISVLYVLMRSHKFSTSLKRLTVVTHLKNNSNLDSATQQVDASMFLECLGQTNPQLERVNIRYGTYWTGFVAIAWRRRMFGIIAGESDLTWGSDHIPNGGPDLASPLGARSNAASYTTLSAFEDSEITHDKFFALPSRPSTTTTVNLRLGLMTFTEQRRAVVLPAQIPAPEETWTEISGLEWLTRGMRQARRLVKAVISSVGFSQR
ncbi:hypothetical protein P691DRAFT_440470 [Macrolepiota fuliginosa MF-IS2]|uniref:Uncharacterized protein n=1 Tax=Macrolepiota fuliginosa MF-IS2 TaxID=1400762 RepID=A0A9P5XK81_9AGAR|nr:hypothetical protein P691DRAFT_440470 [Macrolepiota fuliginosa MF-IS2]